MELLFQKTQVKIPNEPSPKEERKLLLHAIGGGWYVDKFGQELPPLKERNLNEKAKK